MNTVSIEVNELSCSYGDIPALDRVTIQFRPGEIMALLGPNGAGKSTLISCLAGLREPDSGGITFNGKELSPNDLELRRQIGYIPDQPPLPSGLTILYYIGLMVRLYEKEESVALEERVVTLLDEFEMLPLAGRGLSELSRGQLYKAALVAHIAVDPPVWILDEPFASGMDPVGLMAFKDQARAAAARGRCVLFSTQILDVAEDVADRVCVLHKGSLVVEGTLAEVGAKSGDLEKIFRRLKERE